MHPTAAHGDQPVALYWLEDPNAGLQLSIFPYVVERNPPSDDAKENAAVLPDDLIGMYYMG